VFVSKLQKYHAVSEGGYDICFSVPRDEALETFPLFRFELLNEIWLELLPIQYVVSVKSNNGLIVQCVDIMNAGNELEGIAFGSTNMLDMLISYDYSDRKLGFMRHSCDNLLPSKAVYIDGKTIKVSRMLELLIFFLSGLGVGCLVALAFKMRRWLTKPNYIAIASDEVTLRDEVDSEKEAVRLT